MPNPLPREMRAAGLRVAVVSAAFLMPIVTGCVPTMEPVVPTITGRVVVDKVPAAGARILVVERAGAVACQGARLAAVSGADGAFLVEGRNHLVLAPLAGDPEPRWEVCVEYGGVVHPGYRPFGFGLPSAVQMTCDVSRIPTDAFDGVCR